MSIINTSNWAQEFAPVGRHWFLMKEKSLDPIYPKLFEVQKSNSRFEVDVAFSGFKGVSEINEGAGIVYDSAQEGPKKTYSHTRYGTGFIITLDMIEDGQDQVLMKKQSEELAKCLMEAKENILATVFDNAFTSAYAGFDGKELCATDHPIVDGTTIANELATPADLSESALEQALIDIKRNMLDYRGKRVRIMPKRLIVPPEIAADAHRIIKSPARVGTPDNDINYVGNSGILSEIFVHERLADTDAFFIQNDVSDGLKVYQRRDPYFGSENDFDTENMRYAAREKYSYGFTDYRVLFGSPGV